MKSRIPTIIIAFVIPMAAIILCFPIYNRIEPFILGFSFNYFWIFAWLFLTSLCLFIGYRIDPYNDPNITDTASRNLEEAKAYVSKADANNGVNNFKGGGK